MENAKPAVFISSTIKDFSDLRSSLHWWLKELEFTVQASESCDFDKKAEHDTLSACVDLVKRSDYFILLIGNQKGSTSQKDGDSITYLEYKAAHESYIKTGRPIICPFLRTSTDAIINTPTLTDSIDPNTQYIRNFVREIEAQKIWVNRFKSFQELTQTLQIILNAKNPLKRKILEANLLWELEVNMKTFFQNSIISGKPAPIHTIFPIDTFKKFHFSNEEIAELPSIQVPKDKLLLAELFLLQSGNFENLHTTALERIIASGEFLEYDIQDGKYVVGQKQEALLTLRSAIRFYKQIHKSSPDLNTKFSDLLVAARNNNLVNIHINDLIKLVALYNTHFQVYQQILYLLKYFYTATPAPLLSKLPPLSILGKRPEKSPAAPSITRGFIKSYVLQASQG